MGVPILIIMVAAILGVLLWPAIQAYGRHRRRMDDPLADLRREDEAIIAKLSDHRRRRGGEPKGPDPQP